MPSGGTLPERAMWTAWSSADDAARETGALCDREEVDEVTYLMIVEARDLLAKAMRREGFTEWTCGSDRPVRTVRIGSAAAGMLKRCPLCKHEWRRHDPDDGMCDAHAADGLGPCQCGRDLAWMQDQIAASSRAALGPTMPDGDSSNAPIKVERTDRDVLRSVWKTLAGIGPNDDRARIEAACAELAEALS